MKDWLTLALLAVIVAALYAERDKFLPEKPAPVVVAPTPTPPVRHLAPEGIFYLVEYVSVRTPHGITGFVPGEQVSFVSANQAKGLLTVTDGTTSVEVGPMQITNDLDVAALAKRQDQDSQHQLASIQEAERKADVQMRQKIDIEHANNVARLSSGAAVGANSTLDRASEAASSFDRTDQKYGYHSGYRYYNGSPYYYLYR